MVRQGLISFLNLIQRGPDDRRVLALTFDISWGEKTPDQVLNELERNGVTKATFFLSGSWVLAHPAVVRRIMTLGYEIGSHGDRHENYTEHDNQWIAGQVGQAEESIYTVTGTKPRLIRTPNGDYNRRVLALLYTLGYFTVQWSVDSLDWQNPGVEKIISRVLTRAKPGSIVLLHASDTARQTEQALEGIITGLREHGYDFATVSELIESHQK